MSDYKLISAGCPVFEPNVFADRFKPSLRDRAPRLVHQQSADGTPYDVWLLDGIPVGTFGPPKWSPTAIDELVDASLNPSTPLTQPRASDPHAFVEALQERGVWGTVLQPNLSLFCYGMADTQVLSEVCRVFNDWIAEFSRSEPERLRGVGMLNVDDVGEACRELRRIAALGLYGAFVPAAPLPGYQYDNIIYEPLWVTAEEVDLPLLLHTHSRRHISPKGVPPIDLTMIAGRANQLNSRVDPSIQQSLTRMILGGVFERHTRLKVGTIGSETAHIPDWLNQMDGFYKDGRSPFPAIHRKPSEYWSENLFVELDENDMGIRLRDEIGVENMLWRGSRSYHSAEHDTTPGLIAALGDIPQQELKKIVFDNAAKIFRFRDPPTSGPTARPYQIEPSASNPALAKPDPNERVQRTRQVNAWIEDGSPPLCLHKAYTLGVNIGEPRANILVADANPSLWTTKVELTLLVVVSGMDFSLENAVRQLLLPRDGNSESVYIKFVPLRPGSLLLRLGIYLARDLTLLQEFEIPLEVRVEEAIA